MKILEYTYTDHPWLKPVRFPFNRFNKRITIADYPFFKIESEELHEVGVGPIHAGIIEPGHFRFICNGEQILHLEIQLGYQHRGIEQLFLEKKKLLQRITLAENIAGDSVAGHTVAFVNLWESLCRLSPGQRFAIGQNHCIGIGTDGYSYRRFKCYVYRYGLSARQCCIWKIKNTGN